MIVDVIIVAGVLGPLLVGVPVWCARSTRGSDRLSDKEIRYLELQVGVGPEFDLDGELFDDSMMVEVSTYSFYNGAIPETNIRPKRDPRPGSTLTDGERDRLRDAHRRYKELRHQAKMEYLADHGASALVKGSRGVTGAS